MPPRAPRSFGVLAALLLAGSGCSTPSVPLPPPVVDVGALGFSAPAPGQVVLTGKASTAHLSARVTVLNRTTGDGVITTAELDGSFTTPVLPANPGDVAQVELENAAGVPSDPTCITIALDAPLFGETCL